MPDHVMEELWAVKDSIAEECGYDMRRLFDKLKEIQESGNKPTVDRSNLKPTQATPE